MTRVYKSDERYMEKRGEPIYRCSKTWGFSLCFYFPHEDVIEDGESIIVKGKHYSGLFGDVLACNDRLKRGEFVWYAPWSMKMSKIGKRLVPAKTRGVIRTRENWRTFRDRETKIIMHNECNHIGTREMASLRIVPYVYERWGLNDIFDASINGDSVSVGEKIIKSKLSYGIRQSSNSPLYKAYVGGSHVCPVEYACVLPKSDVKSLGITESQVQAHLIAKALGGYTKTERIMGMIDPLFSRRFFLKSALNLKEGLHSDMIGHDYIIQSVLDLEDLVVSRRYTPKDLTKNADYIRQP